MEILSEYTLETENTPKEHQLTFHGEGSQYFGVWIVNIILTAVTFGLYYPWARAAKLQYFFQETELDNSRFQFHGTGKEMFLGFIKAIGIIIVVYATFLGLFMQGGIFILLGLLVFLTALIGIIPFVLHGSAKYRASRTSWRSVHMGYRGDLNELIKICIISGFLSIITLGLYSSWMKCNIRKYMMSNMRFGNVKFDFKGEGFELFKIHIVGFFLSMFTFGIYLFWYMKDLYNFNISNIVANQDGRLLKFQGNATGRGFFSLMIGNFFMTIFTLGLAAPWVAVRTMKFVLENAKIEGDFRPSEIRQTEAEYKDALGDDITDMMDIGIV
jgi:uncharacterized membrane protein YjgN (DUF898 family)